MTINPRVAVIVMLAALCLGVLSTLALTLDVLGFPLNVGPPISTGASIHGSSTAQLFVQRFFNASFAIAPASWAALCGAWIWRGKMRAKWNSSGFTEDSFELLLKMKGGPTRVKLLNALEEPRDRSQLAQEMGIDWKAVDRQVQLLSRYSFIKEVQSFGSVKVYALTAEGKRLLALVREMTDDQSSRSGNETEKSLSEKSSD